MDPFLLTHRITDFLFDIGCRFHPISIRDQMIRGFLITDRLQRGGLISETKPLLVIGAGVAGATAALVALDRNVPVTLVDKAARAFLRQAGSTRFISPTLYDWPAEHWVNSHFPPPKGVQLPLSWDEGQAGQLSATWLQMLNARERERELQRKTDASLSQFKMIMNCEVADVKELKKATPNANGMIDVTFEDTTEGPPETKRKFASQAFSVILGCSGPGEENCKPTAGEFEGVAFWEVDSLNNENYDLANPNARVLLSGGGDGALQDLIRLITNCQSPREILQVLPADALQSLITEIQSAEDAYLRSFIWGIASYDCRSNHKLDSIHKRLVNSFLDQYGSRIEKTLDKLVRENVLTDAITMVHPCDHFTTCYSINRAVAHLLLEFVKRRFGLTIARPFTTVQNVWNPDHECGKACSEFPHFVEFAVARCQHIKDQEFEPFPNPKNPAPRFDLIILRHGARPKDLFGERPSGNHRQVLPYYIDLDWY